MPPNYYDGKLCSVFESCLRNKFEGLQTINEIKSDYVKASIKALEEEAKPKVASTPRKYMPLSDLLK